MEDNLAIGVDIGGSKLMAVLVDHAGRVVDRSESAVSGLGTAGLEDLICAEIARLLPSQRSLPVGVAAAGLVDGANGMVRFSPHLPWLEEPLRERLAIRLKGLGVDQVVLENDVNAALWAEARFGAASGTSDVVMVTVGTGIGGAFLVGGRLYRGRNGMAGEFGHLTLEPVGHPCECGLAGCWEQYASGRALGREMLTLGRDLDGPRITAAARSGDPDALTAFQIVGRALGRGLSGLVTSLDPGLIVVGGGVCAAGELLLAPAREELGQRLVGTGHRVLPQIVSAELGPAAGAIGAADLAREQG